MRPIHPLTDGFSLISGVALTADNGLASFQISIPLDKGKYLAGVNLIDCIKPFLIPDLVAAIPNLNQEILQYSIFRIGIWLTLIAPFATIGQYEASGQTTEFLEAHFQDQYLYPGMNWLVFADNAAKGNLEISFDSHNVPYAVYS